MIVCHLCDPSYYTNTEAREKAPLKLVNDGLICVCCRSYTCMDCCKNFVDHIRTISATNPSSYILSSKKWLQDTTSYIYDKKHPVNYICNWCIVNKDIFQRSNNNENANDDNDNDNDNNNKANGNNNNDKCFPGSFYIPEYRILIDSPGNCTDIHSLTKEEHEGSFESVWHCVLDPDLKYPKPRNIESQSLTPIRRKVTVSIPYSNEGEQKKLTFDVMIYVVQRVTKIDPSLKGNNRPSKEDIQKCFLVTKNSHHGKSKDPRVLIVVGDDGPLLLCRFLDHNSKRELNGQKKQNKLYEDLLGCMKNKNLQTARTGGSSGTLDVLDNKKFCDLIYNKSHAPRLCRGVLYMFNNLCVNVVYRNSSCEVKSYAYSFPVTGGNFVFQENKIGEMLRKYRCLGDMLKRRVDAALLIHEINQEKSYGLSIVPQAVSEEQSMIQSTNDDVNESSNQPTVRRSQRFLENYGQRVRVSIVAHPVGMHRDRWSSRSKSRNSTLESKITLNNTSYHGRGRGGEQNFTVALLTYGRLEENSNTH